MTALRTAHAEELARLAAQVRTAPPDAAPLGLAKRTSNLFRDRSQRAKRRLDVDAFSRVIEVNAASGWVDAGGMTTYEDLLDATLAHGTMPAVVPQLRTITIGGAAAGVGIEATSFRHGLVHDTLLEMDVMLPGGDVVTCSPDNDAADLFFGFPNSYGTLGYALGIRARTLPVKRFVRREAIRFRDAAGFFAELEQRCRGPADFVDGVVFGPEELVLCIGTFVDDAPFTSDYGYERIYYRSLRDQPLDYLATRDYLWRWDTDWFWCSKNLHAQNPIVRRLIGRKRLNSRTYQRVMRWNARWGITRSLARLRGLTVESVIQDVDIPLARAEAFLAFLLREIPIRPVWICPIGATDHSARFTLYPLVAGTCYVNFGFWDAIQTRAALEPGHFNRMIEREVIALDGIKSLYSESYFDRATFEREYGIERYRALKAKYDPGRRALDLYDKCVLRA